MPPNRGGSGGRTDAAGPSTGGPDFGTTATGASDTSPSSPPDGASTGLASVHGASSVVASSESSLRNCPGANPPNIPSVPGAARTGAGGGATSGCATTTPLAAGTGAATGRGGGAGANRRAVAMLNERDSRRMP
ncbi:hypothetical protein ACN47A_04320 [Myxococcus fulvus]|uniref:hypothetical protein n=1 Tax=Myxococcus fulvus TaxID=33 RepID=UPI003B9A7DE2